MVVAGDGNWSNHKPNGEMLQQTNSSSSSKNEGFGIEIGEKKPEWNGMMMMSFPRIC